MKNKKGKIIAAIAVALVLILAVGLLAGITNGFRDWKPKYDCDKSGHVYENDECTKCGEDEPTDPTEPEPTLYTATSELPSASNVEVSTVARVGTDTLYDTWICREIASDTAITRLSVSAALTSTSFTVLSANDLVEGINFYVKNPAGILVNSGHTIVSINRSTNIVTFTPMFTASAATSSGIYVTSSEDTVKIWTYVESYPTD